MIKKSQDKEVLTILKAMHTWFVEHEYKGIDPYQLDEKAFGLINKFPVLRNIRKALKPFHSLIPQKVFSNLQPIYHPKALGLIIGGNTFLKEIETFPTFKSENQYLIKLLENVKSDTQHYSWGHPFEWGQNPRYVKNTPLICVTTPIALWLLDNYEYGKSTEALELCKDIAQNLTKENGFEVFDNNCTAVYYSNLDKQYTYNGSALLAAFLFRFNKFEKNKDLIELAERLLNFVLREQNPDGSWFYSHEAKTKGDKSTIDNRHTGYILESLNIIYNSSQNERVKQAITKGKIFYLENLFENGLPKWSISQTYPIDIHDVAQAIITLSELGESQKAEKVIKFALTNMFNGKDEFYYKIFKNNQKNKTVFIRWGQAWMYQALSKYLWSQKTV